MRLTKGSRPLVACPDLALAPTTPSIGQVHAVDMTAHCTGGREARMQLTTLAPTISEVELHSGNAVKQTYAREAERSFGHMPQDF